MKLTVPPSLFVNLNQTLFSYVPPGKCTFSFRSAKIVSIKRVDDKRQICRFFAVTFEGKYSAIQHIYQRKSNCFLRKHEFPASFSTSFTENHSSNTGKFIEFLRRLFFCTLKWWNGQRGKRICERAILVDNNNRI